MASTDTSEAFATIVKEGGASYRHTWSTALTSPFEVYQEGYLLQNVSLNMHAPVADATTTGTELVLFGTTSEPPVVELFDANTTGTPRTLDYPPWLTIQWRGSTENAYYRVEEYDSTTWNVQHIISESGQGYYNYQTDAIADGTAVQWRVVAYDADGNASEVVADISDTIVTLPGAPSISVTYTSADTTITVSAA